MKPIHRTALTACCALAAFTVLPRDAAPGETPPRHHVTLWTFGDDCDRPGFADAVRALGADSVSASPGQDVAPFKKQGLSWYEDAASGKGTLGIREKDFKPAWDAFYEARKDPWPSEKVRSRPMCLRDPEVVKRLEAETLKNTARATKGAWAISLDDEPSMTLRANPVDWCLCDRCVTAFREAMTAEYKDLAALNTSWGTDYGTWRDVKPWTTAAMKARVKGVSPSKWNLAPWMETRAFQDRTFASISKHLCDVAATVAPGIPCGITGTQAPSAFGGWDYGLLRTSMTFIEPYDIGLALPICRDLFPKGTVIAQTVFPNGDDGQLPRWRLWRGVARGANATIVWSSHDALTRDGKPSLTQYGEALAEDLALLSAPGGIGAKLARATPLDTHVVVLYSQASVAVRWMLDSVEDGDTWPRRFGSYEATHSTAIKTREAAWRAVCDQAPRFVDVRDLESFSPRIGLWIAPDLICLSQAERENLESAAHSRAEVIAQFLTDGPMGVFDELGRATPACADVARIDPAFKCGGGARSPIRSVRIVRADGGPAPRAELGLFADGRSVYVVAVPAWEATADDAGAATASIPRTTLTFTFEKTADPGPEVVDLRTGKSLGRAATWTSTSDAAGGLVFELRP